MPTPYDTPIRLAGQEVDELARRLAALAGELADIARERATVEAMLRSEPSLIGETWILPSHAFAERMRGKRARLDERRAQLEAAQEGARQGLADAQLRLLGLQSAADLFLAEARRKADRAEQAAIDDRTAARHVEAARRPRPRARPTNGQPHGPVRHGGDQRP